mgnify:CR=1 FL=1
MANTFKEALNDTGMADTRVASLVFNLSALHNSVAQMDQNNLKILSENYPAILQAVQVYARHERGLNRFEQYE